MAYSSGHAMCEPYKVSLGLDPGVKYLRRARVDTLDPDCHLIISSTRLSLSLVGFPTPFNYDLMYVMSVLNPDIISNTGLASSNFARHYFRNLV